MTSSGHEPGSKGRSWISRIQSLFALRARTWALMVPLHLTAFFVLYALTARLLESEILSATEKVAAGQLAHAGEELHAVAVAYRADRSNGHPFEELLAAHAASNLQLILPGGLIVGPNTHLSGREHDELIEFLRGGQGWKIWLSSDGKSKRMRGLVRIVSSQKCVACHQANTTLAVASMSLDLTEMLARARAHSRRNLGLLILAWAAVLGLTTAVVRRSVQRSAARLEAELEAAQAGESSPSDSGPLILDPGSARLHRSLRTFLQQQHKREVEVASRLEQTDRLASLGKLAAGLAHEIKNPLAGIQGALEILRQDLSDEVSSKLCEEMLDELGRVNQTLQSLLASARPTPARLVDTEVRGLLEDLKRLLDPGLRRRQAALELDIAPGLPTVKLDPAKIRQVLVNLVNNAAEAMDDGGHVTIRAGSFPEGEGLILTVEDDGPGISADSLEKIFEPFFTTKFAGTGLGLAIARSLVEQHGGSLEVESEPGSGTTFFIFLPSPDADADATPDRIPAE